MPVLKCSNGLFRIGTGPCVYKSKAKAERAYAAYRAQRNEVQEMTELTKDELVAMLDAKIRRNAGWALRQDVIAISELGISGADEPIKKAAQSGYDDIIAAFQHNDNVVKATRAVKNFGVSYVKKIIKAGLKSGSIQMESKIMVFAEQKIIERLKLEATW